MIAYNPKNWFGIILKIHKAETFRILLPTMFYMAIYSAIVATIELEFFHVTKESKLNNLSVMFNVLGFVMSLLLVFRTNSAYDRWWEGRKMWGSLVNVSRNMAIKLNHFIEDKNTKNQLMDYVKYFPYVLKSTLRNENGWPIIDGINCTEIQKIAYNKIHAPTTVVNNISKIIHQNLNTNTLTDIKYLTLQNDLNQLLDITGACERIKNTPIPFTYSAFLKKFLFIFVIILPIAYVGLLNYLVIPLSVFIFYVMASIELIADEIENPFGKDDNDLPIDTICKNIKSNIESLQ